MKTPPTPPSADNIVAFLADIFARRGAEEYLGEGVTMAEHMLQSAMLAEQAGASDTLVAAALLHDIGHFTSEFGSFSMSDTHDRYHEQAGARVLEPFFPSAVVECVRLHVPAKRYLCAVDTDYLDLLSPASVYSLQLQGGPMSPAEAAEFTRHPHHQHAVTVRRLDDAAKVVDQHTPDFAHYAPLLERIVSAHGKR